LLVIFTVASTSAQERSKPSYKDLLERVKKSDPKVDFTALRMVFTETDAYKPYDFERGDRDAMRAALRKKDYAKALKQAEKCLQKNYLDIEAHSVAWRACKELKNQEKAKCHRYVRDGLLQSIQKSGDGKSPKTAFVVICTDEEYAVLDALGIKVSLQALIKDQGHNYDRTDGVSEKTGKDVTQFFNIDRPFKWLEESLSPRTGVKKNK
jgi:hypothetical protein